MNMTEVKTADLAGAALDWAVANACGFKFGMCGGVVFRSDQPGDTYGPGPIWSPSTDWSQGGPLIGRYQITLLPPRYSGDKWGATYDVDSCMLDGDTPLISACRAIVAAKLGDVVSVPSELLEPRQ